MKRTCIQIKNQLLLGISVVISCTFLLSNTAKANSFDAENNDTYQTANAHNIDVAGTGTVGYEKDPVSHTVDYQDWYIFTLPSDSKIQIIETTSSELYSGMYLYDSDGTNQIASKAAKKGGSDTLTYVNLAAGTYYLCLINWNYSYGSYTFNISYSPALHSNDAEPNSTFAEANTLAINTETTGHIGYYSNYATDYDDWYKFTLPVDSKILITETTSENLNSAIYLYDSNGTNQIASEAGINGGTDTLTYVNLGAGDYFVRIQNWNYSYGSYKLKINTFPIELNNDAEPNSTFAEANTLAINTETTGHIGYYSNYATDYDDWYKFTLPVDSKILITETTSENLNSAIYLYDSNGTNQIASEAGINGGTDTLTYVNLGAGDYFVRIQNWNYSYGSYKLKINTFPIELNNDAEPNSTFAEANTLAINTETTGHIGYYSNYATDYDDWYRVEIPAIGQIQIIETTSADLYSGIYLYDETGTNLITGDAGQKNGSDTVTYKNLTAGTYFVRIYNWNYSYGSYSVKVNFSLIDAITDLDNGYTFSMAKNREQISIKSNDVNNIEIYNLLGKRVFTTGKVQNNKIVTIDISSYPNGLYLVKIFKEGKIRSEKFTKH